MNKNRILLALILFSFITTYSREMKIKVYPKRIHSIDHRIFGHFLERPSWGGEFGIEDAVINNNGDLDPRVIKKLKKLKIPVLRFPGGTDVDYMDWTDMIDLPEREKRPVSIGNTGDTVTNYFGYDEFAELTGELDCESIIPINFFDAFLKRIPLDSAAIHNVGLLAYTNAEKGQKLPDGMRDWPSIRLQNGYDSPHNIKYIQIGNETWALWQWKQELLEQANLKNPYKWYVKCVARYLELIEKIDPNVRIIVDHIDEKMTNKLIEAFGDRIDYFVFHSYLPWEVNNENTARNGKDILVENLDKEEVWNAMVGVPNKLNRDEMSLIGSPLIKIAEKEDLKVAVTEWNWNGWWQPELNPPLKSVYAHAVGVAGFLHGMLRSANVIKMGCQSMLVGSSWGITGIRVDKEGNTAPYYLPTSQMTSFYAKHHGKHLLDAELDNVPVYNQPLKLAGIEPKDKVAYIDFLPTGSKERLALFFINRDLTNNRKVIINLASFTNLNFSGQLSILTGVLENEKVTPPQDKYLSKINKQIEIKNQECSFELPARSVSVLEISMDEGRIFE